MNRMKKNVIFLAAAAALLLTCLTDCKAKTPQDLASEALSLDLSAGSEISSYDTHSGNGDGTSCIVLSFQDDAVLEQIQESVSWHPLPWTRPPRSLSMAFRRKPVMPPGRSALF